MSLGEISSGFKSQSGLCDLEALEVSFLASDVPMIVEGNEIAAVIWTRNNLNKIPQTY